MGQVKIARIRELNDAFRKSVVSTFSGAGHTVGGSDARTFGRTLVTAGIEANGPEFVLKVLIAVADFEKFTGDNDPHGEHDFGNLKVEGLKIYFKIDYYDATCVYGSEDPSDPTKTTRVMTVMLASEY